MNLKKTLYYSITSLTGFVISFAVTLKITGTSLIERIQSHPSLIVFSVLLCFIWVILLFTTSVVLLIKENLREEFFLMFAGTNAEDELEQIAVNDAIKKTFLFNLLILITVVVLSGFKFTKYEDPKDGKNKYTFSFTVMNEYDDDEKDNKEKSMKVIESLNLDEEKENEAKAILEKVAEGESFYLIPKVLISPFGALCFILLQFVTFRSFLFFNRRRFL
jgi:hypothetical protein